MVNSVLPVAVQDALGELSAAQLRRLMFIEFRLWFYGQVRRKEVISRFGMATAAGTRDLALYLELAPHNCRYERKSYVYEAAFQPLFNHQVENVLEELTTGTGIGEQRAKSIYTISHARPTRLSYPRLADLAAVTRAIYGQYALGLRYYSITEGLQDREIVPHAIVDSGIRWHARAFDRQHGDFRDVVLTRMQGIRRLDDSEQARARKEESSAADVEWNRTVTLQLVPHPGQPHKESIRMDLNMQGDCLQVEVSAAMAGYYLRQWVVDCSADASLNYPEYRLYLANRAVLADVRNAVLAPGYINNKE